MNDDIDDAPTAAGPARKRTAVVAAAVGVAGLVAGGLAAGAISSASAASGTDTRRGYGTSPGYGARPPAGEGREGARPGCGEEKLLTGTTKTKVTAAVEAKYPDATIERVETSREGAYEAHIVEDGKHLVVLVSKAFKVTGTRTGPPAGGPGGPGDPGGRHGAPGEGGPGEGGPAEGGPAEGGPAGEPRA